MDANTMLVAVLAVVVILIVLGLFDDPTPPRKRPNRIFWD